MEITIPPALLLLPLLLIGAAIGFRRSWARETITGLALAAVLVAFDRGLALVRAVLRLVARVAAELAEAAGVRAPDLAGALDRAPSALLILVCTVLFVAGAYWLGNVLGNGGGASRLQTLAGGVIGALNMLLLVAIVSVRAQEILGAERLQRLFLVPGSRRGLDVEVSAFPSAGVLAQWGAYAVIALILVAFGWGVSRLPRLMKG